MASSSGSAEPWYEAGKVVRKYWSATELMKDFDGVFTKRVLNALKTARFEALFVRDQGAMIGFGEVWLGHSRSGVGIHAINP